jgi:predicted esterase
VIFERLFRTVLGPCSSALYHTLGGYGWQNNHTSRWSAIKDFEPAIESFDALITPNNFPGADFNQVHAIGFSQGAAFMYSLALLLPGKIKVMAGLSGFVPNDAAEYVNNEPLKDTPILSPTDGKMS